MQLIGLKLPAALELLDTSPTIIETAPPSPSKTRVPIWGEARVLRATQRGDQLELLVARELLGEDKSSPST
jgi:hypothetical protein